MVIPPPLAVFVGSLTGCMMTQIRAFATRLYVLLIDLQVKTRVEWDWEAGGRTCVTSFRETNSVNFDIIQQSSPRRAMYIAIFG